MAKVKLLHFLRAAIKAARSLLLVPLFALAAPVWGQSEYASDPFDPIIARDAWVMISQAEQTAQIPAGLLHAMSLVETGQGIRGWVLPWPYTVGVNAPQPKSYASRSAALATFNTWRALGFVRFDIRTATSRRSGIKAAEAQALLSSLPEASLVVMNPQPYGRRFADAEKAQAFVSKMFAMGHTNLDLGMMQINWRVHGKHFASVASVFDPTTNVNYAVTYLLEHRQKYDWWGSVGRYHSGTPYYANRYIKSVYNMYLRIHRVKST